MLARRYEDDEATVLLVDVVPQFDDLRRARMPGLAAVPLYDEAGEVALRFQRLVCPSAGEIGNASGQVRDLDAVPACSRSRDVEGRVRRRRRPDAVRGRSRLASESEPRSDRLREKRIREVGEKADLAQPCLQSVGIVCEDREYRGVVGEPFRRRRDEKVVTPLQVLDQAAHTHRAGDERAAFALGDSDQDQGLEQRGTDRDPASARWPERLAKGAAGAVLAQERIEQLSVIPSQRRSEKYARRVT